MIKPDLFQSRKGVHIKLDKETHAELRTRLFRHGMTMQEFFDEFARAYVNNDPKAVKFVDSIIIRNVQFHIEGKKPEKREHVHSELDSETLYDLISSTKGGAGGNDGSR